MIRQGDFPRGTVLRRESSGGDYSLAVALHDGQFRWLTRHEIENDKLGGGAFDGLSVDDDWTVVYQPTVPAPSVGELIDSPWKAEALPVGAVAVDTVPGDDEAVMHPTIKVGEGDWMWFDPDVECAMYADEHALFGDDNPHRVIHIPDRADAGTGRTAA